MYINVWSDEVSRNLREGYYSSRKSIENHLERVKYSIESFESSGTYSGDRGYQDSMSEESDLEWLLDNYDSLFKDNVYIYGKDVILDNHEEDLHLFIILTKEQEIHTVVAEDEDGARNEFSYIGKVEDILTITTPNLEDFAVGVFRKN